MKKLLAVATLLLVGAGCAAAPPAQEPSALEPTGPTIGPGCVVVGCSSHICTNEENKDMLTTCEYRDEYACYKQPGAKCEKGHTGECGWKFDEVLDNCIVDYGGKSVY